MHKNIMDNYGSKLKTKLYKDKNFDSKGVDYTNYIAIKYESINKGHIKDRYTINGWYLLWYLMANAQQKQYIKTAISIISKDLKLSEKIIKTTLIHLHDDGVIQVNCYTATGKNKSKEQIKGGDTLEITIVYNHTDYSNNNGYRALPVEWVRSIITTISAKAWAILTIMIVKYSFFTRSQTDEGYSYQINHYAFPTYTQIEKLTGISKATIKGFLKELLKSRYAPIHIVDSDKDGSEVFTDGQKIRDNYCYDIELLSRIEYQYYHTYIHNKDDVKNFDKLIGTNRQFELRDSDYIISKCKLLKQYDKAIKEKDTDWYNIYGADMIMRKEID